MPSCCCSVTVLTNTLDDLLIAPVKSYGDVPLDLASLLLREVTLNQLPTQVDELIHHMTQLMEKVHLVFLLKLSKQNINTLKLQI